MGQYAMPFPGRELADKELSYDLCYGRIPPEDRKEIVEKAWQKGCDAARQVYLRESGCTDFSAICRRSGLTLQEKDTDFVTGGQRYFSDYLSGKNLITLYLRSISLWAEENQMDVDTAKNLILSHEYFHFLEMNGLGLTSRMYQVPMLQIGSLKLGKTGIRALSEIGAHAFARTYFELSQKEAPHATQS